MSLSVSQGEFASFLDISVEKTDVLVEVLLGGAVIALALAPFMISFRSARRIAVFSAFLASACYAAVGITMHVDPALDLREIIVIASFAMGGFAVAFFAPLAQLSIRQSGQLLASASVQVAGRQFAPLNPDEQLFGPGWLGQQQVQDLSAQAGTMAPPARQQALRGVGRKSGCE